MPNFVPMCSKYKKYARYQLLDFCNVTDLDVYFSINEKILIVVKYLNNWDIIK